MLPLSQAAEAHRRLERREVRGVIVLANLSRVIGIDAAQAFGR